MTLLSQLRAEVKIDEVVARLETSKKIVGTTCTGEFPHNQCELPQKCCICMYITKFWFTNCATQVVKQGFIL
jgi:hypothetical protein